MSVVHSTKAVIVTKNWTTTHKYGDKDQYTCTIHGTGNNGYIYCRDCGEWVDTRYFEKRVHDNCGVDYEIIYQK